MSGPDVTTVLNALAETAEGGDEEQLALIHSELCRMAGAKMARERLDHTLQPTALVHEAFLRLGGLQWNNRAHFYGAASEAMRRILIERARRRLAVRRGGGAEHVPIRESALGVPLPDTKLVLVHEALESLAVEDELKANIVKLHIFAGLTHREIAALLEIGERTSRRHWEVAKVRLFEIISKFQAEGEFS